MSDFYKLLKIAVLHEGVSRAVWADFVRTLRAHLQTIACFGSGSGGKVIIRAWRRERRVAHRRIEQIAHALAEQLKAGGTAHFQASLVGLNCCRGFEAVFGAPIGRLPKGTRLATAQTVTKLCHFYFDPDEGVVSEDDPETLSRLFRQTNPAEQEKLLRLFRCPLGKRTRLPDACQSFSPPFPERFDVVWAAREADVLMYHDGDLLRDVLGLVHFYKGEEIVLFSYASPRRGFVHVPTVVEAMGGWAFWPAPPRQPQTTINYRTGHRGLREFVHAAEVPPKLMYCEACAKLG